MASSTGQGSAPAGREETVHSRSGSILLKGCKYIVTQDAERTILEDADIRVRGNRIAAVGGDILPTEGEKIIDCSSRIVMPGLVNAHTHLGMTSLRGLSDDKELPEWLEDIHAAEKRFGDGDILEGARIGIRESLRSGTTSIIDMYFRTRLAGEVAEGMGVRFLGAEGFLPGHPLSSDTIKVLEDISGRVRFCLGPHAIYSVGESGLRAAREVASQRGIPLQIHLAETRKERAEFFCEHKLLPVQYLDSIGFLADDVMLVHCNWLTKGELDIIARHGCTVIHCPQSNMKLAGGSTMPLQEMRERGIRICLGTDSAVSNNSLDMFREMHTAALIHKHHYWNPTVAGAQSVLDMATIGGARVLGQEIGALEQGMLADIITLDLADENLHPHRKERIVSNIVYAASGLNVSEVIVDGRVLLEGKRWVDEV